MKLSTLKRTIEVRKLHAPFIPSVEPRQFIFQCYFEFFGIAGCDLQTTGILNDQLYNRSNERIIGQL